MSQTENRQKTTVKVLRILIPTAVAAAAVSIFLVTRMVSGIKSQEQDAPGAGLVYDSAAVEGGWTAVSQEEIETALNEQVEEGYINISMNTEPVFESGTSSGNLMIVNDTINRYPQQVTITRNDTGETIYSSGAIPVGSKIPSDTLDVPLEAGTYPCTAMFHSLDPETGEVLGSAGAYITITVKN